MGEKGERGGGNIKRRIRMRKGEEKKGRGMEMRRRKEAKGEERG